MGNLCCCVSVRESMTALKEKSGRFDKTLQPGCHIMCFGEKIAGHVSKRLQHIDLRVETKTQDNMFVSVVVSIHYKLASTENAAYQAFYSLADPDAQIQSHAFQILRTKISKTSLDALFSTEDDFTDAVKVSLNSAIQDHGYEISKVLVVDITLEKSTKLSLAISKTDLTAREVLDTLLVTQYQDSLKEIAAASNSSTVFVPQFKEGMLQTTGHI